MITTNEDDKTIVELSLISGVSKEEIEKVFIALQPHFAFKYCSNKAIHIPYVGNFLIRYRAEEITDEGKEAQVDAFFAPHPQVKRIVGQLKDIEKTGNFTELDVFTQLKKQIKQDFKTVITDEDFLER